MQGTKIQAEELKARWALSEIYADRWRPKYASFQPEKVRQGVTFEQLTSDEKIHLAWMCSQYRGGLASDLDKAREYECQSWTKDQLGRTYTLPRMAPNRNDNIPFLSFIACPRFDEVFDPRVHADCIPFDTPFQQTEPVIVITCYGIPILIEGYLRSVLFMRARDAEARILVWYPVAECV